MVDHWTAKVFVSWSRNAPEMENFDWLADWSEVKWVEAASGQWDIVLWVDVPTPQELEEFVQSRLWSKRWASETKTVWVKETWARQAA